MMNYIFSDRELIFSENVLNVFGLYVQNSKDKNEAGGILLGQIVDNRIYITKVSIPSIFDKASRYSFERDKIIAQLIIDYEFINSGRKTIYLGEWHTHPENSPTPSGQDQKMIKEQFKRNKNIEPYIFLVIQGIKSLYVGVYDGQNLKELKVI